MEVVERYTPTARWFHWLIVGVFIELVLSGLLIFIPWLTYGMVGIWIRLIHRAGAAALIGAPTIYALINWRNSLDFIKEAFIWGKEDLDWLKAAPGYYFGGDPRLMPPQGYINTGMKLYRLSIFLGGVAFVATGFIMWFFKGIVPPELFQWCVVIHDVGWTDGVVLAHHSTERAHQVP